MGLSCSSSVGACTQHPILVGDFLYSQIIDSVFFFYKNYHSFCDLPEIGEEVTSHVLVDQKVEPFWKQWRCIFGFIAQTGYVYVID